MISFIFCDVKGFSRHSFQRKEAKLIYWTICCKFERTEPIIKMNCIHIVILSVWDTVVGKALQMLFVIAQRCKLTWQQASKNSEWSLPWGKEEHLHVHRLLTSGGVNMMPGAQEGCREWLSSQKQNTSFSSIACTEHPKNTAWGRWRCVVWDAN